VITVTDNIKLSSLKTKPVYNNFIKSSHVCHQDDRAHQQALYRWPKFPAVSPFGIVGGICNGLFAGMIISELPKNYSDKSS
jgi:hypothetical protein